MNMKKIFFIYLLCFPLILFSQELDYKYLFYSNESLGKYKIYILNKKQFLTIKNYTHGIVLLHNEQGNVVDTLQFMNQFNTYLQDIIITGSNRFSINSTHGTAEYEVENNQIKLKKGYCLFCEKAPLGFEKITLDNIDKPLHLTVINDFLIFLDWNYFKTSGIYVLHNGKKYQIADAKKIALMGLSKNERTMQDGFANSYLSFNWHYYYYGNKVFINSPAVSICYIFDLETKQTRTIQFPLNSSEKAFWFYMYDYIQKKNYVFKLYKNQSNELYFLDLESNKLSLVAKTVHKIYQVIDGKMHIMANYNSIWSHFLVPFNIEMSDQNQFLIQEIEVN